MEIKSNNSASSKPVVPPTPVAASARAVDVQTDAVEFSNQVIHYVVTWNEVVHTEL